MREQGNGLWVMLRCVASGRLLCGALVLAALYFCGPARTRGQELSPAVLEVQQAVIEAIARAEKSVVAIARVRKGQDGIGSGPPLPDTPLDPTRPALGNALPTSPDFVPQEFATGVVIDRQGYVVTNYHVLGDPRDNDYYVWVQRRPFQAVRVDVPEQIRAGDPWTDLAVLKVAAEDLQPITLGDASALRKGSIVIALGNPYGIARDGEASASWGIVANLRRVAPGVDSGLRWGQDVQSLHQFGTLIQTDARLNLGTSGGALINLRGEMVGLTTSLAAVAGYEQSAGFAIPVDDAFRKTVETLTQGRVPAFGFLGVQPEHLSLAERQSGKFGARISYVVPGTPADQAGLRPDDVITHVDGERVDDKTALFRELSRLPAQTEVTLTVAHDDSMLGRPRVTTTQVVLSKKYVDTPRKPFAQVEEPRWRGLRVDYASAAPPQWSSEGQAAVDPQGCVVVLEVQPDSPAWHAGLRPGQYVSHVGAQRVATPQAFHEAVGQEEREVRLRLTTGRGDDAVRVVLPVVPR